MNYKSDCEAYVYSIYDIYKIHAANLVLYE